MKSFTERYSNKILGVISCFDRVVITGTLLDICYAQGMAALLRKKNIRIFDYTKFAEPLREEIRKNAEKIARDSGLEIEFIRRRVFRKEQRIKEIVASQGDRPGLAHIFSATERMPFVQAVVRQEQRQDVFEAYRSQGVQLLSVRKS